MIAKRSKAIDMRFHWLKCRSAQKLFSIKWKRESSNKADYHSKRHPPHIHQTIQTKYLVNSALKEHDIPAHVQK
eukprot:5394654-Ditylum_brightwellii.AAC.1